jgi:hypothetical protein
MQKESWNLDQQIITIEKKPKSAIIWRFAGELQTFDDFMQAAARRYLCVYPGQWEYVVKSERGTLASSWGLIP